MTRPETILKPFSPFDLSFSPVGDAAPALGIIAHTRKPKSDEKAQGRALINLLAGSYVLASVPRAVFILQAASDDPSDDRIVFTCCKNNNGTLGAASAWQRRNGLFLSAEEFDWDEFNNGATPEKRGITAEHLLQLFENGARKMIKKIAVKDLQDLTKCGQAACYAALNVGGKFATNIRETDGFLQWILSP